MAEKRIARLMNYAQKCGVYVPELEDALKDYMWTDSDVNSDHELDEGMTIFMAE